MERSSSPYGLLARFRGPEPLLTAARALRDAGFKNWDTHTPFPVHGMDDAMGLKPSRVPLFVLVLGLGGAAAGMLLQWWVSVRAYPLTISGKPFFSWPAFVPIMFEVGVLGGATGAVLGFLGLSKLPRHHHELFSSAAFEHVTDDGFFVSIEASDPQFDADVTPEMLRRLGAVDVETVMTEEST